MTTKLVRLSAVTPAETMTLPSWRGCKFTSTWRSPLRCQTCYRPSTCLRQNLLSSEKRTVLHCSLVHLTWFRDKGSLAALTVSLWKPWLLDRNTGLVSSYMVSVPDGLNWDLPASWTPLLSTLSHIRSIGLPVSENGGVGKTCSLRSSWAWQVFAA